MIRRRTGWAASPGASLDSFASAWAQELHRAGYAALSRRQRHELTTRLTARLAAALAAEPFSAEPGVAVGGELVAAGFVATGTLGATVTLLHERLGAAARADAVAASGRDRAILPGRAGSADHTAAPGGPVAVDGAVPADLGDRVAALAEALCAGYVAAARDHTLDAQESLLRAAYEARAEAVRALRRSQERLRHAALHDPLTGLPNRVMLDERLHEIITAAPAGGRLGLCLIDIDRFTAVNASAGHPAGDRLLIAIAQRLHRLVAAPGRMLARVGADEFAILQAGTGGAEDMTKLADQALAMLGQPFRGPGGDVCVTACAGIVETATAGADPVDLTRSADITLRWAKHEGPGTCAVFDPERNRKDVARYRLTSQLPDALRQEQFTLHYQPIVDLADGQVRGVEALARWLHPTGGLLGPDEFIGPAEDTGLILPLGRTMIDLACQQAAQWQSLPRPPFVSVNVSVRQLRDPLLVAHVASALDRTGLPPGQLQLEITESLALANDHVSGQTLNSLARLGVHLALDDFGSGYANLAYLRNLPIDAVKLAAAFINGSPNRSDADQPADLTILGALISLAHALGLTVTAEGIETPGQAERLRNVGCDLGQGWYLGRAVPASAIVPR